MMTETSFFSLNSNSGQALVEYMLIFSLFALIAFGLTGCCDIGLGSDRASTVTVKLLTEILKFSFCPKNCRVGLLYFRPGLVGHK